MDFSILLANLHLVYVVVYVKRNHYLKTLIYEKNVINQGLQIMIPFYINLMPDVAILNPLYTHMICS